MQPESPSTTTTTTLPRPSTIAIAIKEAIVGAPPLVPGCEKDNPATSEPGTSAFPFAHQQAASSIVIHPPLPPHTSSTPSPGAFEASPSSQAAARLPSPLAVPSSPPLQHPRINKITGFRRGSLFPTASSSAAPSSPPVPKRRGSDPSEAGPSTAGRGSPKLDMSRAHEVVEMTTNVSFREAGAPKNRARFEDGMIAQKDRAERSKEDLAMAKWRKWVIEQPIHSPTQSPEVSPAKPRKLSPPGQAIPMIPLSPLDPSTPVRTSPHNSLLPSSPHAPSRASSDGASSRISSRAPSRPAERHSEIYNTATMQALQDVELAVDETLLLKAAQRAASQPRRMSSQPRIMEIDNPFIDIASRLSSRRVRPLVIELIQALGHYIDASWYLRYPERPCPWAGPSAAGPSRRSSGGREDGQVAGPLGETWRSKMIAAVQEGKASGHVSDPPTKRDLDFWQDEVKHALRDVDDVVGIYKGVGWAFNTAMVDGRYGVVDKGNVLGNDGDGGNIARLLNDLEEAMWGDAPPRPTDLAYDLPIDFDPYAIPDEAELQGQAAAAGGALSAFFTDSARPSNPAAPMPSPVPEEIYNIPLPDLSDNMDGNVSDGTDSLTSPDPASTPTQRQGQIDGLNLDAFRIEGKEMTLEEIGKRRHQEWLQSRRTHGSPW